MYRRGNRHSIECQSLRVIRGMPVRYASAGLDSYSDAQGRDGL